MLRPLPFDSLVDQHSARLSVSATNALLASDRRIVITGPGGWIGRATLSLLTNTLGREEARRRVHCFGSRERMIELEDGVRFEQQPLARVASLPAQPSVVLHLAFLTKDKVVCMGEAEYRHANWALSQAVANSLDTIGADRLFLASSGAATHADDIGAAADLRLYGRLKRDDEELFSAWARAEPHRRKLLIGRIFSLSGPYINKHQTYALASFILDALAGRPVRVNAPMPVVRSYVAIRELMSLVFASIFADGGDPVLRFDTGGEALELAQVARCVADTLGPVPVERKPLSGDRANHYAGDDARYRALLCEHGVDSIDLPRQVIETAAYLAKQAGIGE